MMPQLRSVPTLLIHGGAGTVLRSEGTRAREEEYLSVLTDIVDRAFEVLAPGGSALEAVALAVSLLEDCPLFNAGRGSVLNSAGIVEMDAAIMDGQSRRAGSLTLMRTTKNPIQAALALLESQTHVFLGATYADDFARIAGIEQRENSYFITEQRLLQLEKAKGKRIIALDHDDEGFGTVGAVALDAQGHLAAATSTGGLCNKAPGRIGDSPVLGAGTWAENGVVAVSATGEGEYILRCALAKDIATRMSYRADSVDGAARSALEDLKSLGGSAGVIALAANGEWAMPFTTSGMYRGIKRAGEAAQAAIFS